MAIWIHLGVDLPLELAQEICAAKEITYNTNSDIDLECVILIARLLANKLMPPPKLHGSVARIFDDQGGMRLREHLSNCDDSLAEGFEENLCRLNKNI
ncbi:hypothetical protein N7523_005570 [Penicillium sp. IBT 18751x]|nr:hypothetical protein N7523_005844 [Penicillium sp. IBT 18751x]KAJ6117819.1 hypothetical protein N7523_005570 [Penicillium sp. IBT 18751x]